MFKTLTAVSTSLMLGLTLHAEEAAKPAQPQGEWKIKEVRKIWDYAEHNGFTDLIYYKDHWYCTFREATEHRGTGGRQRVIRSKDGVKWESVAHMAGEKLNHDVRDPKFSVTPDGQLMLNGFIAYRGEQPITRESLTWFSPDGVHWSERYRCPTGVNTWRWKVRWHNGYAYCLAYNAKDAAGTFYRSKDGKTWEVVAENVFPQPQNEEEKKWKSSANENDLLFEPDGSVMVMLRRDTFHEDGKGAFDHDVPGSSTLLGFSKPPYKEWTWKDLGVRTGGPVLLKLSDGRIVSAVRLYDKPRHTGLLVIDPVNAKATKVLRFPTGGDTGYAGMVEHNGELWVSYYSSHEGHSCIYLARVEIPKP